MLNDSDEHHAFPAETKISNSKSVKFIYGTKEWQSNNIWSYSWTIDLPEYGKTEPSNQ